MKTCTHCKVEKNDGEFSKRTAVNGKRYLRTRCKVCANKLDYERKKEVGYQATPARRERINEYRKLVRKDLTQQHKVICRDARADDRKKNRGHDLDPAFVAGLIENGCSYCGEKDGRMTCDRVDNDLGHLKTNVVAACMRCNLVRGTMPHAAWTVVAEGMRKAREDGLFGGWQGKTLACKSRE